MSGASGFGIGSLAAERNPWVSEDEVRLAILYRGAIIGGFGQLETGLGEIALSAWSHDAYRHLREHPPYGTRRTCTFLRQVLEIDGPLFRFQTLGSKFLEKFESFNDVRTMMAHGRMRASPRRGFTFQYIDRERAGVICRQSRLFTLVELQHLAEQVNRLGRLGQRLHWRARLGELLPTKWSC